MFPDATPGGGVAVRAAADERRPAHLPRRSWYRALLTCLALTACDQGVVEPPAAHVIDPAVLADAEVLVLSGDDQESVVASQLPEPVIVQVLDVDGNAIPFAPVTWTFGSGRGNGRGNTFRGTTVTLTADEQGIVAVEWELGTDSGPQRAWAEVGTVSTVTEEEIVAGTGPAPAGKGSGGGVAKGRGKKVQVDATSTPAEPAQILVSQTSLTLEVGETVMLTATVIDQYGNVIPDAVVTWTSSDPSIVSVDSPTAAPPSLSFAMGPSPDRTGEGLTSEE